MLISLGDLVPAVDATAYIHSSAHVIGDVQIGPHSSVWFQAVLRGDVNPIRIGARTNIQDHVTVHVTRERYATLLGDDITVGHKAVLHGCAIGDRCLIGIGAIVLDRCKIGEECLIGAGALLTPGTTIEPGQLVLGSPGRVVRPISDDERKHLRQSAAGYVANAARYRAAGVV